MSLSDRDLRLVGAVLPSNTSLTNFTDFRCSLGDLSALLAAARAEGRPSPEDAALFSRCYEAMARAMSVIDVDEGPGRLHSEILNLLAAARVDIERRSATISAFSTPSPEAGREDVKALDYKMWGQIHDQRPAGDPKDTLREIIAALSPPAPEPGYEAEPVAITDEVVRYIARYGGMCRDCADEDGVCPASGLPCEPDDCDRAIRHVLRALSYGQRHGYIKAVSPVPVAWRPEVRAFADLMEAKLSENDHKPGWKEDHPEDLLSRLYEEADEIRRSWDHWRGTAWPREQLGPVIGRECADVANFAMMIADVCGALSNQQGGEG